MINTTRGESIMNANLPLAAAGAVMALAACGTSSTPTAAGTSKPATSTRAAEPTTVSAQPTEPQAEVALRAAVQAYSDAYLSGNGKAAYALLSARCQKMDTLEEFSALVDQAKNLYGNPLPMTSFKAHIAGGMARVTYMYMITAINQADQPWALEAGGWRDDNC
jgi:hypothetical protein